MQSSKHSHKDTCKSHRYSAMSSLCLIREKESLSMGNINYKHAKLSAKNPVMAIIICYQATKGASADLICHTAPSPGFHA